LSPQAKSRAKSREPFGSRHRIVRPCCAREFYRHLLFRCRHRFSKTKLWREFPETAWAKDVSSGSFDARSSRKRDSHLLRKTEGEIVVTLNLRHYPKLQFPPVMVVEDRTSPRSRGPQYARFSEDPFRRNSRDAQDDRSQFFRPNCTTTRLRSPLTWRLRTSSRNHKHILSILRVLTEREIRCAFKGNGTAPATTIQAPEPQSQDCRSGFQPRPSPKGEAKRGPRRVLRAEGASAGKGLKRDRAP